MKYHKKKLGQLEQKILKYMINRDYHGFVEVSDLWSSLQLSQPTISKSVQSLVKYSYLKRGEYRGSLYPTDKGVAPTIMLGVSHTKLKRYVYRSSPYHPNPLTTRRRFVRGRRAILNYIRKIVNAYQNKQDFVMKQAVKYAIENNYFENGNFRVLA